LDAGLTIQQRFQDADADIRNQPRRERHIQKKNAHFLFPRSKRIRGAAPMLPGSRLEQAVVAGKNDDDRIVGHLGILLSLWIH
jgi:hypothetical protein